MKLVHFPESSCHSGGLRWPKQCPSTVGSVTTPIRLGLKRKQGADFTERQVKCQGPLLAGLVESTLAHVIIIIILLFACSLHQCQTSDCIIMILLFACSLHQHRRLLTVSPSSSYSSLHVPYHHYHHLCIFFTPTKASDCIIIITFAYSPHQRQRLPTGSSSSSFFFSLHVPYTSVQEFWLPSQPSLTYWCGMQVS